MVGPLVRALPEVPPSAYNIHSARLSPPTLLCGPGGGAIKVIAPIRYPARGASLPLVYPHRSFVRSPSALPLTIIGQEL